MHSEMPLDPAQIAVATHFRLTKYIADNFENFHDLPANISTHVVSSRQNEQYYGFFGEFSPLSNFHPALFIHEGVKYHTSE